MIKYLYYYACFILKSVLNDLNLVLILPIVEISKLSLLRLKFILEMFRKNGTYYRSFKTQLLKTLRQNTSRCKK